MNNILITGADGYIGKKVCKNLLVSRNMHLYLWMRADSEDERESKRLQIEKELIEYKGLYTLSFGNLKQENPFKDVDKDVITEVIHSAAVIRFNVDEQTALKVNLEGTNKIINFAKSCKNLNTLLYVSTVYSSGPTTGEINEDLFSLDKEFVNFYEKSKCQSEIQVANSGLNYKIARLSTVISDSKDGEVIQFNVFHNTLRLLYNGLISILPGDPDVPLYFITGDFAAKAIVDIFQSNASNSIYNVCHDKNESASMNDLLECVFETFYENEIFRNKRIMKPLFANEETFNTMAKAMENFSQGILADALGSITPFAKQLYISKSFSNKNLKEVMNDYEAPNAKELIKSTTRYLVKSKWGRNES